MNEQDERLIQLYLKDIRKKKMICISITIFFIIGILFYGFYIKNNNFLDERENSFQENNISNIDTTNEVKNTIIQEKVENQIKETKEDSTIVTKEEKTEEKPKESQQTKVKTNSEKITNEKPANKDFLFTDGYTMDNVTQAAQNYLKSSGRAGECIPIQDNEGIYLGMRVIFY